MDIQNCWTLAELGGRVIWLNQLGEIRRGQDFFHVRFGQASDNKRLLISRLSKPFIVKNRGGKVVVAGATLLRAGRSLRLGAGANHSLVRVNSPATMQLLTNWSRQHSIPTELSAGCYGSGVGWPGNLRINRSAYSDDLFDLAVERWFVLVDAAGLAWKVTAGVSGEQPVISAPSEAEIRQVASMVVLR